MIYMCATKEIKHKNITTVSLTRVLDSTDHRDYIERVEPSSRGGQKMALI